MHEGRHRAVGAAQGDTVHPSNGGVPDAPGYLDYEYDDQRASGGVPVTSLSIDDANDGTRDQGIAAWEAKHGMTW